jgi:hypothetical protein
MQVTGYGTIVLTHCKTMRCGLSLQADKAAWRAGCNRVGQYHSPRPLRRSSTVNRQARALLAVALLAVTASANAEAQLPDRLQNWLQPLPNCRTMSCIMRNIPNRPRPRRPVFTPSPVGNGGPVTTTPEPLTMALLGTGLAGIGMAARRRNRRLGDGSTPCGCDATTAS